MVHHSLGKAIVNGKGIERKRFIDRLGCGPVVRPYNGKKGNKEENYRVVLAKHGFVVKKRMLKTFHIN
jgi:hypothetical protein